MTKEEIQAIRDIMREELAPVHTKLEKLDNDVSELKADTKHIKKQVDILYDWVDGIDLSVRELKKAK